MDDLPMTGSEYEDFMARMHTLLGTAPDAELVRLYRQKMREWAVSEARRECGDGPLDLGLVRRLLSEHRLKLELRLRPSLR